MKTLKQYTDVLGIMMLNGGAIIIASPESLEVVKSYLQITAIAVTIIYTCLRMFMLRKKNKKDED